MVCDADSQKAETPSGNEQDNQGYAGITERPNTSYIDIHYVVTLHLIYPYSYSRDYYVQKQITT